MPYGSAAFKYPGGKSKLSDWIVSTFPEHECYAEPFAGSAAVLLSKPASTVEVLNDTNEDIIHFFRTVRDKGDELAEWVRGTPYSRSLYEEWVDDYYRHGRRPDDDVKRAGVFLYTLQVGFSGGFRTGFSTQSTERNPTRTWRYKPDDITDIRDRLRRVVLECLDYEDVVDKYDHEDALFYFDPPYVDAGDDLYAHEGKFDHERFVETLRSISGKWVVSYEKIPESFDVERWNVIEQTARNRLSSNANEDTDVVEKTERLITNFDPDTTSKLTDASQSGLDVF